MKRVFLIGLIVCTGFFSRAQQDVKAKEILDEVSNKTSSYKSIVADFVFTMQNKEMEIDERNEGTIKLKGQKYVELYERW